MVFFDYQWQKNTSRHRVINRSPYDALFAVPVKCGTRSTSLLDEVLNFLESEEDLELALQQFNVAYNLGSASDPELENLQSMEASSQQEEAAGIEKVKILTFLFQNSKHFQIFHVIIFIQIMIILVSGRS